MGPFNFDPEKATEALLYVAARVRRGDLYAALKVLYLADKCHLIRYGRFIAGDSHFALDHGATPQQTYDLVKFVRGDPVRCEYPQVRDLLHLEGNTIVPHRDADPDVFSASDLECLDEVIAEYGHRTFGELKQAAHDQAYDATLRYQEIRPETIASMAEDRAALIQHIANRAP